MGGSHYHLVNGLTGGVVPRVDLELAPKIFRGLHAAIARGLVRACHDLSEGGLAVAVAEMAFAGGIGAEVTDLSAAPQESVEVLLFAESTTRFLLEVRQDDEAALANCLGNVPLGRVGRTTAESMLRINGRDSQSLVVAALASLKEAWQKPLRW
jgi:phosphoribosylformylglycinamidine synthase